MSRWTNTMYNNTIRSVEGNELPVHYSSRRLRPLIDSEVYSLLLNNAPKWPCGCLRGGGENIHSDVGTSKEVFLVYSITTLTARAAGLICTWSDKKLIIRQGDPRGRTISVIATQYLSGQQTVKLLIQDATFSRGSANAIRKHPISIPHIDRHISILRNSSTGYCQLPG